MSIPQKSAFREDNFSSNYGDVRIRESTCMLSLVSSYLDWTRFGLIKWPRPIQARIDEKLNISQLYWDRHCSKILSLILCMHEKNKHSGPTQAHPGKLKPRLRNPTCIYTCLLLAALSSTSWFFFSSSSGFSLAATMPRSWSSSPKGVIMKFSSVT